MIFKVNSLNITAYKPSKIKISMGGSRSGKSRWEKTETLKEQSKTLRREKANQKKTGGVNY